MSFLFRILLNPSKFSPKMNGKIFLYLFLLLYFDLCHAAKSPSSSSSSPSTTSSLLNDHSFTSSSKSNHGPDLISNKRKEFVPSEEIGKYDDSVMKCLYYNQTLCETSGSEGCGGQYQICHPVDNADHTIYGDAYCFALWYNSTEEGVNFVYKGCWFGASKSCSNDEYGTGCVASTPPKQKNLNFCCCKGMFCNQKIRSAPQIPNVSTQSPAIVSSKNGSNLIWVDLRFLVLLIITIIFIITVISFIMYFFGKCPRKTNSDEVPTNEPLLNISNSIGYVGLLPIQLQKALAHGKFGTVWQAIDGQDKQVAVKVLLDQNSWQIEKNVYSLPKMQHNNILTYLGAEQRGEGLNSEFWIITEYHSNGSLHDYLKSHTVDWKQLLTIIQGISKGLAHLHEEFSGPDAKPSIAHRDFKSKNVLLSNNFRACIADFGLALVFYPNTTCGDAHGQVGTRRYMAPEVLEGAINFTRDSFLKIDMYACGLVLWELLSRCCFGEYTCKEYSLPFENEVGLNPSIEDMQDIVAQQKKRPQIMDSWMKHPGMSVIVCTMQDCWDQEAEARISAETIFERVQSLIVKNDHQPNYNQLDFLNQRTALATNNSKFQNTKNSFLPIKHINGHNLTMINGNGMGSASPFMYRETDA